MTIKPDEVTEEPEEEQTEQDIADLEMLEAMEQPELPGEDGDEELEEPAGEEAEVPVAEAQPEPETEAPEQTEPDEEKNLDDYFKPVVNGETRLVKKNDEAFITAQLQKAAAFEQNSAKLNKDREALGIWEQLRNGRNSLPNNHPNRKKFDDALLEFAKYLDNPGAVQATSDELKTLSEEDRNDPVVKALIAKIDRLESNQRQIQSGQSLTQRERQDAALRGQIQGLKDLGATDIQIQATIEAKRQNAHLRGVPLGDVYKIVNFGNAPAQVQAAQPKGEVSTVTNTRKPAPPATPQGGKQSSRGGSKISPVLNALRQKAGLTKKQWAEGVKSLKGNPRGGRARGFTDQL